jgi:hypothetical protein
MQLDRSTLEKILISCKGNGNSHFTLAANLKPSQIKNAIAAYAPSVSSADVVGMVDDTLFGSGKDGFLITCTNLYSSYFGKTAPILNKIIKGELVENGRTLVLTYESYHTVRLPVHKHGILLIAVLKEIIGILSPVAAAAADKKPDPNYKYSITGRPTTTDEMFIKAAEFYENNEFGMALHWFIEAGSRGHTVSRFYVGYMLHQGEGMPRDIENAINWYTSAAEDGQVQAMLNLGSIYYRGDGVPVKKHTAMYWYAKAAELGNPIAQNMCGTIEYEDLIVKFQKGRGYMFDTEWKKVHNYFSAAAKQGNPNAQYMLGVLYENGHGVRKSLDEARQWYQKAAAQGHSEAKKKL